MIDTPHLRQMFQFFEVADPTLEQEARRELDMLLGNESPRDVSTMVVIRGEEQRIVATEKIGARYSHGKTGWLYEVPVVIVETR